MNEVRRTFDAHASTSWTPAPTSAAAHHEVPAPSATRSIPLNLERTCGSTMPPPTPLSPHSTPPVLKVLGSWATQRQRSPRRWSAATPQPCPSQEVPEERLSGPFASASVFFSSTTPKERSSSSIGAWTESQLLAAGEVLQLPPRARREDFEREEATEAKRSSKAHEDSARGTRAPPAAAPTMAHSGMEQRRRTTTTTATEPHGSRSMEWSRHSTTATPGRRPVWQNTMKSEQRKKYSSMSESRRTPAAPRSIQAAGHCSACARHSSPQQERRGRGRSGRVRSSSSPTGVRGRGTSGGGPGRPPPPFSSPIGFSDWPASPSAPLPASRAPSSSYAMPRGGTGAVGSEAEGRRKPQSATPPRDPSEPQEKLVFVCCPDSACVHSQQSILEYLRMQRRCRELEEAFQRREGNATVAPEGNRGAKGLSSLPQDPPHFWRKKEEDPQVDLHPTATAAATSGHSTFTEGAAVGPFSEDHAILTASFSSLPATARSTPSHHHLASADRIGTAQGTEEGTKEESVCPRPLFRYASVLRSPQTYPPSAPERTLGNATTAECNESEGEEDCLRLYALHPTQHTLSAPTTPVLCAPAGSTSSPLEPATHPRALPASAPSSSPTMGHPLSGSRSNAVIRTDSPALLKPSPARVVERVIFVGEDDEDDETNDIQIDIIEDQQEPIDQGVSGFSGQKSSISGGGDAALLAFHSAPAAAPLTPHPKAAVDNSTSPVVSVEATPRLFAPWRAAARSSSSLLQSQQQDHLPHTKDTPLQVSQRRPAAAAGASLTRALSPPSSRRPVLKYGSLSSLLPLTSPVSPLEETEEKHPGYPVQPQRERYSCTSSTAFSAPPCSTSPRVQVLARTLSVADTSVQSPDENRGSATTRNTGNTVLPAVAGDLPQQQENKKEKPPDSSCSTTPTSPPPPPPLPAAGPGAGSVSLQCHAVRARLYSRSRSAEEAVSETAKKTEKAPTGAQVSAHQKKRSTTPFDHAAQNVSAAASLPSPGTSTPPECSPFLKAPFSSSSASSSDSFSSEPLALCSPVTSPINFPLHCGAVAEPQRREDESVAGEQLRAEIKGDRGAQRLGLMETHSQEEGPRPSDGGTTSCCSLHPPLFRQSKKKALKTNVPHNRSTPSWSACSPSPSGSAPLSSLEGEEAAFRPLSELNSTSSLRAGVVAVDWGAAESVQDALWRERDAHQRTQSQLRHAEEKLRYLQEHVRLLSERCDSFTPLATPPPPPPPPPSLPGPVPLLLGLSQPPSHLTTHSTTQTERDPSFRARDGTKTRLVSNHANVEVLRRVESKNRTRVEPGELHNAPQSLFSEGSSSSIAFTASASSWSSSPLIAVPNAALSPRHLSYPILKQESCSAGVLTLWSEAALEEEEAGRASFHSASHPELPPPEPERETSSLERSKEPVIRRRHVDPLGCMEDFLDEEATTSYNSRSPHKNNIDVDDSKGRRSRVMCRRCRDGGVLQSDRESSESCKESIHRNTKNHLTVTRQKTGKTNPRTRMQRNGHKGDVPYEEEGGEQRRTRLPKNKGKRVQRKSSQYSRSKQHHSVMHLQRYSHTSSRSRGSSCTSSSRSLSSTSVLSLSSSPVPRPPNAGASATTAGAFGILLGARTCAPEEIRWRSRPTPHIQTAAGCSTSPFVLSVQPGRQPSPPHARQVETNTFSRAETPRSMDCLATRQRSLNEGSEGGEEAAGQKGFVAAVERAVPCLEGVRPHGVGTTKSSSSTPAVKADVLCTYRGKKGGGGARATVGTPLPTPNTTRTESCTTVCGMTVTPDTRRESVRDAHRDEMSKREGRGGRGTTTGKNEKEEERNEERVRAAIDTTQTSAVVTSSGSDVTAAEQVEKKTLERKPTTTTTTTMVKSTEWAGASSGGHFSSLPTFSSVAVTPEATTSSSSGSMSMSHSSASCTSPSCFSDEEGVRQGRSRHSVVDPFTSHSSSNQSQEEQPPSQCGATLDGAQRSSPLFTSSTTSISGLKHTEAATMDETAFSHHRMPRRGVGFTPHSAHRSPGTTTMEKKEGRLLSSLTSLPRVSPDRPAGVEGMDCPRCKELLRALMDKDRLLMEVSVERTHYRELVQQQQQKSLSAKVGAAYHNNRVPLGGIRREESGYSETL